MRLLVARLRDHRPDPAIAQMSADRARGVRLVPVDRVGPGAGTPHGTCDSEPAQQRQQRRRVTRLARRDSDHQRQTVVIDELMDLRRQSAPGATDRVIRRLDGRIRVIRSSPL